MLQEQNPPPRQSQTAYRLACPVQGVRGLRLLRKTTTQSRHRAIPARGDIDDEGRAYTEPVAPALADVDDADIDMSERVLQMLEGLRGDAFSISRDRSANRVCPPQSEEASELFRQGQLITGPLAKQQESTCHAARLGLQGQCFPATSDNCHCGNTSRGEPCCGFDSQRC